MNRFTSIAEVQAWANRKKSVNTVPQLIASERDEQESLIARARLYEYQYPALSLLCHIKNEGTTWSYAERRKALASGIIPGMVDLVLFWPAHGWHAWAVELKALDGKPTKNQKRVISELTKRGYYARFCYGQDSAWDSLMWYLGKDSK